MKLSILLTLFATADSLVAAAFFPGTNMYSRKSMKKWRDYLYEDQDFKIQYRNYISKDDNLKQKCPTNILETDIKLASALGRGSSLNNDRSASDQVMDWSDLVTKSTSKLDSIKFTYYIMKGDTVCGVARVNTGLEMTVRSVAYKCRKPTLNGQLEDDNNVPFDLNKVKLSAGDAFKKAKKMDSRLNDGFIGVRLLMTPDGLNYVFHESRVDGISVVRVDAA